MPDAITLETVQAMQAMQMSMAYSTAVQKLSMDTAELAGQTIEKMLPPPPAAAGGQHIIDTYA